MAYTILNPESQRLVIATAHVREWAAAHGRKIAGWAKVVELNEWDKENGATLRLVSGGSDYQYITDDEGNIKQNVSWREHLLKLKPGTKYKYYYMLGDETWSEDTLHIELHEPNWDPNGVGRRWYIGGVKK